MRAPLSPLAVIAALAVTGCVSDSGPTEPYAFAGSWDCEGTVFRFTNTTYDDGTNTYPILAVAPDGRNFVLRFANGYLIALAAVTETGMTWVSSRSDNQLNCRRIG